ncbi:MAG: sulfite exporter TauE/SafE family protein [Nitrosomonadales bacterium]|nr:sulfite exporter TauE/SafE family protein [Nitrosomonadales bacterium]
MYFPVAGIEISPWIPPVVAFAISLFTSMGGVSGAFLLLPFQVSVLGFHSPAVSATNHLFNMVAIPGGVWRYAREGRMVWPLAWIIILGTLPGVFIGALARVHYLADPEDFKFFVGLVLLYLGGRLVWDLLLPRRAHPMSASAEARFQQRFNNARHGHAQNEIPPVAVKEFSLLRLVYEFCGQRFDLSTPRIALLSFIVGIVGGIYGIGGGAIMAPFLISFFGLPVYTAAGAALMATFVTSVAGVAFYQLLAPFYPDMAVGPDWMLGLLFGAGGLAGIYCGAMLQKYVPARTIKLILAAAILVPAAGYLRKPFR